MEKKMEILKIIISTENKIKEYKLELSKKDEIIEELKEKIKSDESHFKQKEQKINDKIKFLENMEDSIENEQQNIERQKKEIKDAQNNFQNIQNQVNQLKMELNNLSMQKSQIEQQIQKLQQQYKNLNLMNNNNNINNNLNMMNQNSNNMGMNNKNFMMLNRNSAINNNMNVMSNNMNIMNNNMNVMNNNMNNINNMNNRNMHGMMANNLNNNMINNQQRNNQNPPNPKKPIDDYRSPTLIGLQNIGATHFMNATIQCLSQTEDLTNYFLDNKRRERIIKNNIALTNNNSLQLSPVYLSLLQELWNKNKYKGYVNPQKFMKTIEEMNSLFKLGQPGDSKDFIIFILEQFHRELKKGVNINNIIPQQINQYEQETTLMNFLAEFQKETSVISDVFYGILETNNICLYCRQFYSNIGLKFPICYNYQIFNCIIFPLEKVKNFTKNKNNNNNNKVTIYDCFEQYQEPETFTGENRNYCNICKQLFNSIYITKIYSSPNVLVLILNRGKNNMYNVKLDFYETIDITNYVAVKEQKLIYELQGVITHYGESGPNAHFLAFCKSPVDKKWYRYNDAVVSPIKNLKNDVIDFGNPYILFYQKKNT